MKKTQLQLAGPAESAVLAACARAQADLNSASLSCLIAGQLLAEHRAAMARTSHDGKSSIHGRNQHSQDEGFLEWLDDNGLSKTTAYRWMDIAGRVAKLSLGLQTMDAVPDYIDIEGTVTLSQALTAAEGDLTGKALKFRQAVFEFMADKTLSEALAACSDGESDPKRITLAAGGKRHGGTRGEDRKAFDEFTRRKLKHLTTFFSQHLSSGQKGEIVAAFNRAVESWPRWLLEALADKCRAELKLSDNDRATRMDF